MNLSDRDTVKTISKESMTYMAFASVDETDTTMNKTMPNNVKNADLLTLSSLSSD